MDWHKVNINVVIANLLYLIQSNINVEDSNTVGFGVCGIGSDRRILHLCQGKILSIHLNIDCPLWNLLRHN